MQLDGAFGAPELGPIEQRGAQVDDAGVQTQQLVFETELVARRRAAALRQQLLKDGFVDLPGALPVGVGQRRARRSGGQAQMPRLALAGRQAAADLAQRLGTAELAKQHGDELSPAGEAAGVALPAMLADGLFKLRAREQL